VRRARVPRLRFRRAPGLAHGPGNPAGVAADLAHQLDRIRDEVVDVGDDAVDERERILEDVADQVRD
jgi:hypothetical protein